MRRSPMIVAAAVLATAGAFGIVHDQKLAQRQESPDASMLAKQKGAAGREGIKRGCGGVEGVRQGALSGPQRSATSPDRAFIEYVPDIRGMVIDDATKSAQFSIISADGSLTSVPGVSISTNMGELSGACGSPNAYWNTIAYKYPYFTLYYGFEYETEKWTMANNGAPYTLDASMMSTDLTYNPSDGKIYGCFDNGQDGDGHGYEFGTIDFVTGEKAVISPSPQWNAIAADAQGNIYAIDMEGYLLSVDSSTGETSRIGATQYEPVNLASATFDHRTGKLYWTVSSATDSFLCEVNTSTGEATKICDISGSKQVTGLYVCTPLAADEAPAAPTSLALDFEGGATTGCLAFDAPASLFRGQDASGDVAYRVMMDGVKLAEGTVAYGATDCRTVQFSVGDPGRKTLVLICSNEAGDSPKAEITGFIGSDAPALPTNVMAVWENGVFTVNWTAPAGSANGGYVNPDEVTYTVTRLPDNVVVADGIKATSITDEVAEPDNFIKYTYTVQAEYQGYKSGIAKSNGVGLGFIVPPYADDFTDQSAIDSYITYDGDGDGRSFGYFFGMLAGYGPLYGSGITELDDWLFTPGIKLEAGKFYKFGLAASSQGSTFTESFEVCVGKGAEPAAMGTPFMNETICTAMYLNKEAFSEYFSVAEDGIYNIGIHHNTSENPQMLYIDDLSISEPLEGAAPEAVTDLTVTPWPEGQKKATFAFTAPVNDLQGEPLPFLERIDIKCDGELIHSVTGAEPGSQVSVDVDVPTSGMHTFTVTACNGSTEGRPSEVEVHVGLDVPATPQGFTATGSTDGTVSMSWEAVTQDCNGLSIPASDITYLVVRLVGQQQEYVTATSETSFTYSPLEDPTADQGFFQYAVFAHAEAGYGSGAISPMVCAGAADILPWQESFAGGYVDHIIAGMPLDGTNGIWTAFGDQSFTGGVKSFDADNGMMGMYGPTVGDKARLFTGRIDMSSASTPALSFRTFNMQASAEQPDLNEITILVDNLDGQGFKPVKTLVVNEVAEGIRGWAKGFVDLKDAVTSPLVQIAIDAETKVYLYTLIDALEIFQCYNTDLAVASISAPQTVELDQEFEINAVIENCGRLAADNYDVVLKRNGEVVARSKESSLASGKENTVTFTQTLNANNEEENIYSVCVEISSDGNMADNESADALVRLRLNDYPTPEGVRAVKAADGGIMLSWEEPAISSGGASAVTVDFEDADTADTFPTSYGDWTFIDADKGFIGGVKGTEFPGIQTGSQQSWWVMDGSHPVFGGNTSYGAHSGTKYLCQMYTMTSDGSTSVQCDDWIISPLLSGKEQTVSFWARSYGGDDTFERFQFLTSDKGTEIADFTSMGTVPAVPNQWTLYSYDIPAGTNRFAIRCTSNFQFMLFIDDITYTPFSASDLKLAGYRVYVDGERKGECTSAQKSLRVEAGANDDTLYGVSAVYEQGESRVKNTKSESGVEYSFASGIRVTTAPGTVTVEAQGQRVHVAGADGIVWYDAPVNGKVTLSVAPGITVVTAAGLTWKAIVR